MVMRAGLLAKIEWNLTLAMPSSIFSSNFQRPLSTAMVSGCVCAARPGTSLCDSRDRRLFPQLRSQSRDLSEERPGVWSDRWEWQLRCLRALATHVQSRHPERWKRRKLTIE